MSQADWTPGTVLEAAGGRCPALHCPHVHCHVAGRLLGSGRREQQRRRRRSSVFVSQLGLIRNTCAGSYLSSQLGGFETTTPQFLCLLIWGRP